MSTHDPLDTAGQAEAAAKEAEEQRRKRDVEIEDVKWLMAHEQGRRIAHKLLEKAGVFRVSFSPNAMQMAFNEGHRNMGVFLLSEIHEVCPERYHQMIKEQRTHVRSKRSSQ